MPINFDDSIDFILDKENYSLSHFNTLPEKCPHCNYSISPAYILDYELTRLNHILVCGCPRDNCGKLFIAEYSSVLQTMRPDLKLKSIFPLAYQIHEFSNEVSSLSPKFIEIYTQAYKAEQAGLDEICGVGYRKALEFLVKDYAIKLSPEKELDIKKTFLKPCIVKYIPHPKVAFLAERATWLGNDETHYERKWLNKDVQDLKLLIELTVRYIEMELMSGAIEIEMANGR